MRKKSWFLLFLCLYLFFPALVLAEGWACHFGTDEEETIRDLLCTDDGLIYAMGLRRVKAKFTPFLVKFSTVGKLLWCKSFPINDVVAFPVISPRSEGGVVVAFTRGRMGGASLLWIGAIDSDGNFLWQQHISAEGVIRSGQLCTIPGGYAVIANEKLKEDSFLNVLRLSRDGQVAWSKKLILAGKLEVPNIASCPNGDFVVSLNAQYGRSFISKLIYGFGKLIHSPAIRSYGREETPEFSILMRLSAKGDILWQKRIISDGDANVYEIAVNEKGTIVACGALAKEVTSGTDPMLLTLTSKGALLWQKRMDFHFLALACSLACNDEGFFVSGYAKELANVDMWLGHFSKSGEGKSFFRCGTKASESQGYLSAGPANKIYVGGALVIEPAEGWSTSFDNGQIDGFLATLSVMSSLSKLVSDEGNVARKARCVFRPADFELMDSIVKPEKTTFTLKDLAVTVTSLP